MKSNIKKFIEKLDTAQLKEAKKGINIAKTVLPVISSTSRLYGKDIVEEADKFFQNPATYHVVQTGIMEFISKISHHENTVAKGIFLSVVGDVLHVSCIQISDESIVSISEIEIDEKTINAMSFNELIQYLGIDKIQIRKMLSDVDDMIKERITQLKENT
ncbi:hypothetical protein [Flavihumibacter sp. CACIAM 22H1]|uniref:hypothetical protein n=1 Tax=Flavihumibacter sp. CACIAM 22H1 TaxID=1812911 RepID=UPI0007A83708|nr:hypothetical protein [Flavihumibacter sp. CACIAM 22H1]KYP12908.1 MAG: hypothetical protein A1D16_04035 [Flavihumibacter sp. CACIAM 22H1]